MRILVGVDGSDQGLLGAEWVAQLPLTPSDEVTVAAIAQRPILQMPWGYMATETSVEMQEAVWAEALRRARQAADEGAAALQTLPCPVETAVEEGHPLDALTKLADKSQADLLVVGPHGRGRLDSILLGSISQGLLHAMPTSVLVAREPADAPTRVLLATDGSPASLAATEYIARFPLPADAHIDVVLIADDVGEAEAPNEQTWAGRMLEATIETLTAGGKTAAPVIRHGDAKRRILAAADELDSDMIVTGARGLGGFKGMILGSVSQAISKAAPCSVLVVAHGSSGD
jgi:nucleotide-binding universal stress UspA family protein